MYCENAITIYGTYERAVRFDCSSSIWWGAFSTLTWFGVEKNLLFVNERLTTPANLAGFVTLPPNCAVLEICCFLILCTPIWEFECVDVHKGDLYLENQCCPDASRYAASKTLGNVRAWVCLQLHQPSRMELTSCRRPVYNWDANVKKTAQILSFSPNF